MSSSDDSFGLAEDLRRWVSMSITANNGVRLVAEMSRPVHEANTRTESIARAVEDMSSSIERVLQTSEAAAADARSAAARAEAGREAAGAAVRVMEDIAEAAQESVAKVETLAEMSTRIGDIVVNIETIARQTNLLSLNAMIEAARAGEAGKGFAVVANEVKSLAEQTSKATVDIRERIEALQKEMNIIITAMKTGAEAAEGGRAAIGTTDEEIAQANAESSAVTEKMEEIAAILREQQRGAREVADDAGVISQMSQNNVAYIDSVIETLEQSEAPIVDSITALAGIGLPDATIEAAKSDHMIWMRKLSQMLAGRARLNPDELADHHSCRLGKWYDAQADRDLTSHTAWRALLAPHRRVHEAGIAAARAYEAGDLETATAYVQDAGEASVEVMNHLNALGNR